VRLLQIAALIALALNGVSAILLIGTVFSVQGADDRAMAQAFAGLTAAAFAAGAALLGLSFWLRTGWPAGVAVLVALAPLVITVLPVLL
jgi:hypothetical protein